MGKITVHQIGSIKIKMDTKDDTYFDAKDPHVSFEQNNHATVNHLSLADVDNFVGRDPDEKKAIYWVRDRKSYLIDLYYNQNR